MSLQDTPAVSVSSPNEKIHPCPTLGVAPIPCKESSIWHRNKYIEAMFRTFVASATVAVAASEFSTYRLEQTVTERSNTFSVNSVTNHHLVLQDSASFNVNLYVNTHPNQLGEEYTKVSTLTNPETQSTEFGRSLNLFGNSKTGNQLAVSAKRGAYVYKGNFDSWSVSQTLIPNELNATGLELSSQHRDYGMSNAVDRSGVYDTLAVGCPTCETGPGNFEGSIYIYEVTPKTKGDWTHTQTLYSNFVGLIDGCGGGIVPASFGIGGSLEIDSDTLLASAQYSYCFPSGVSAFYRSHGQWSEQQIFHLPSQEIYRYDVEDDTILLSSIDVAMGSATGVGAVYVNYPDTEAYGAKPKPKGAPHWSVHQILTPPEVDQTDNRHFGFDVALNGNQAVVTSASSHFYIYERNSLAGMWSLQQVIRDSAVQEFRELEVEGSDIYVVTKFSGIAEVQTNKYSTNDHWDCLVVTVEDQFGDGWDGAYLEIETPAGETSSYAPVCAATDNGDGWQFRYCPRTAEDGGLYKMSIVDAPKSKFFWEIQWRVFDEASGSWYQGNHATRMDFHFDSRQRGFQRRAITKNIDANITCRQCPPKPPTKPKPGPHRTLKGHTHAPTISPAPTLAQTADVETWQYMSMTGPDWFDEKHRGTNFYITDKEGRRLVSTGTKCGSEPEMCWQTLPDGEYILRVTGNLNPNRDTASWAFCGRVGGYGTQLDFKIEKGECDALASFSREQYCTDVLHAQILSKLQIVLYGIPETSDISQLTNADRQSFANGLAGLLRGVDAQHVTITGLHMVDGLSVLEVLVSSDSKIVGVDFRDLAAVEAHEASMVAQLTEHARNGNLWTALSMSTVQGSSFFNKVTGATIKSAELVFVEVDEVQGSQEEVANDISDSYYLSFFPKGGLTAEAVAASLGYIIAAVAFIVVVGAVVHSRLQPRDYEGVDSSTSSALSEIESATPKAAASNPMAQSSRGSRSAHGASASTTKKSVALNALMMADKR